MLEADGDYRGTGKRQFVLTTQTISCILQIIDDSLCKHKYLYTPRNSGMMNTL